MTMLSDGKDATKILKIVLPQVETFEDVKLSSSRLRTATDQRYVLKRELGGSLRPVLGAPNGYYELDLQ